FLVYFLKFQQQKQWHYWLAIIAVVLLSLLLIVSLWLDEYQGAQIFFLVLPGIYLICFTLLITKIRAGLEWGMLYIYSWIPLLIGAASQPLVLTGIIEYSFLSHHAFMIAILLELVLMAMALADRMRFQKELDYYNTTHELSSGLANVTLVEHQISHLLNSKIEFATCLLQIDNYHTLTPYMEPSTLLHIEESVIENISPLLNEEQAITVISETDSDNSKLGKVVDGRLIFIYETSDRVLLTNFLNKLQSQIVREQQLNGLLIELNTTIGIYFSIENKTEITANEYIQHALLAIDQNRESDAHLHYYHDLETLNIKDHLKLVCDLQAAIRSNQLHLYHQPQIDLKNGTVYGSEVLLRWLHPEHGFISPELFVRIAEDTGLINELTRWVIDCAFKQLQRLQANDHLSHNVSINISGKDIGLPNFISFVKEKMNSFNVPADTVIFELTESVMVTDFVVLDNLMGSLSELGIKVSIDDYGTGYSSLNYISQLQFDELKIDKAFILNLDSSERNLTIVKTTIDMAKNLNLKVVAEGVESKSIEKKLIDSGCDIGQGYYYTKPLPFDKYLLWLENHNK
ncbi:MAG: EAL domain-containing protein, partial [Psychromonas sp.]|nr:EAL domain-containing protein [Psychromonas sp.]